MAQSFYFLGKIYYDRAAILHVNIPQNAAWAKKYLRKAEEYGIVYDRLHPPLLDKIIREYPETDVPTLETNTNEAKVIIEVDHGSYGVDAIRVSRRSDIKESRFQTDAEFHLESGARHKIKPDVQGGDRAIHRVLAVLGISIVVWLTRG